MKPNVGNLDRSLRIAVGLILLSLVFIGPETPWGLLGLIPLVTGIAGFCPVYCVGGVNTCGIEKR